MIHADPDPPCHKCVFDSGLTDDCFKCGEASTDDVQYPRFRMSSMARKVAEQMIAIESNRECER